MPYTSYELKVAVSGSGTGGGSGAAAGRARKASISRTAEFAVLVAWVAKPDAFSWAEQGRFTVPVAAAFPLADAAAAHELSQTGHARGKIVLTV